MICYFQVSPLTFDLLTVPLGLVIRHILQLCVQYTTQQVMRYRIAGHFCKFRIEEHHTTIKTTKLFYGNRFNIIILSCTNIKNINGSFVRKFARTKITRYMVLRCI